MKIQSLSTTAKASWEWDIEAVLNPYSFINDAIQLGINRIFITAAPPQLSLYPKEYNEFIRLCHLKNIWVEALSGDASWGLCNGVNYLIDYVYQVIDFNLKHPNTFSAIHLDIEPHTGNGVNWDAEKEALMKELVINLKVAHSIIDNHNHVNNTALRLVSVQPRWIWQVDIDGTSCLPKILDYVDEIAVMDYTRHVDDYTVNGVKFLQEAAAKGKMITIGSEFLPEIADVTLADINSTTLNSYFNAGLNEFYKYKSFKQNAVHSLSAYKKYINSTL